MSILRETREYFQVQNQVINPDGTITLGDRFLESHEPTQDTFMRLLNSTAWVRDVRDTASLTEQGLVKIVNGANAKSGVSPTDGFTYVAQVKNLPQAVDSVQSILNYANKIVEVTASTVEQDRNVYTIKVAQGFLTWLSSQITTLQSEIDTLESELTALGVDVDSLTATLATAQSNIATLQGQVAVLQGQVTTNTTNISSLTTRMTTAESNISSLQSQVSSIQDGRAIGELAFVGVNSAPSSKYLLANGSAISRTTYSALFAKYGTTFGSGDGSTTFNLPNYSGKGIRGYNASDLTNFGAGVSQGADTVTIGTVNMPTHSHSLPTSNATGTSTTTVARGNGTVDGSLASSTSGSGTALNIMNPYLTTFVFVKVL